MKKYIAIICAAVILFASGCSSQGDKLEENAMSTLSAIPYTFEGQDGEWQAKVDIRPINEDDIKLMKNMKKKKDNAEVLQDYRSVMKITYSGEMEFITLKYTFADETQWHATGESKKPDVIKLGLQGKDLGGAYFSKDGSIGGPVPPPDRTFTFDIKAQTKDGKKIEKRIMLSVKNPPPANDPANEKQSAQ
ncbi:MAG: hypothetical protein ACOX7H_06290 [Bacillota bacterium]|jgi:hypothetical protein